MLVLMLPAPCMLSRGGDGSTLCTILALVRLLLRTTEDVTFNMGVVAYPTCANRDRTAKVRQQLEADIEAQQKAAAATRANIKTAEGTIKEVGVSVTDDECKANLTRSPFELTPPDPRSVSSVNHPPPYHADHTK